MLLSLREEKAERRGKNPKTVCEKRKKVAKEKMMPKKKKKKREKKESEEKQMSLKQKLMKLEMHQKH